MRFTTVPCLRVGVTYLFTFVSPGRQVVTRLSIQYEHMTQFICVNRCVCVKTQTLIVDVPLIVKRRRENQGVFRCQVLFVFRGRHAINRQDCMILRACAARRVERPLPRKVAIGLTRRDDVVRACPTTATFFCVLSRHVFHFLQPDVEQRVRLGGRTRLQRMDLHCIPNVICLNGARVPLCAFNHRPPRANVHGSSILSTAFHRRRCLHLIQLTR